MDARHRDVLLAIIREYIDSAEPVASRALARRSFPTLSPATLRNVMADLEDSGYLHQPHTSAGRMPTDKGYRFYVEMVPSGQTSTKRAVDTRPGRPSGIDRFMEETSTHLSAITRLTSLLIAPPLKHTTLDRIDLLPLTDDRALLVVVTDSGWVTARALTLDPPIGPDDARKIGHELTRRFQGRTVQDVIEIESAPSDPLDELHTRAHSILEQMVSLLRGRTVHISGATNILDHPEFRDLEATRTLLRTFEQKEQLADLLTSLAEDEGVHVTIGEENPFAELRECALITATYMYRAQILGVLGVVGPRRLPYPEVISAVNDTARHVTDTLSRAGQELYLPS